MTTWRKSWRLGRRSRFRDGGAALVEYALILALVVAGSAGAIQSLTDASEQEVANEMDCVSTRPPPPSCQIRAATTTTTDPSATTSSTEPPSTTSTESTTTTTAPLPTLMTWSGLAVVDGSTWRADAMVELTNDEGPVADALVRVRVVITDPSIPVTYEVTCTTDSAGHCTASFTVPTDLGVPINAVRLSVIDVEADGPVESPPGDLSFSRP